MKQGPGQARKILNIDPFKQNQNLKMKISRRKFLKHTAGYGFAMATGSLFSCATTTGKPLKDSSVLKGIRIIDAHAHPNGFYRTAIGRKVSDRSSTTDQMRQLGMEASAFSALGSRVALSRSRITGTDYQLSLWQLEYLESLAERQTIKVVLDSSQIPQLVDAEHPPGAIIAIEGGDVLQGDIKRIDEFYRLGVRSLTLLHRINNELGDCMTEKPKHYGLTPTGRKAVERMQAIGMVVDVAHASSATLKDIAEISSAPIMDSHTSVHPFTYGRRRGVEDIEKIVATGGIVCTWPLSYWGRETFEDWANEILSLKNVFGANHVGLGTDGGGGLPSKIKGYRDIRDFTKLADAMHNVGLSRGDMAAYMGANFSRVFKACVG